MGRGARGETTRHERKKRHISTLPAGAAAASTLIDDIDRRSFGIVW